jgi:hypothetical protein
MSAYPYPANEAFPDDADSVDYQLNWNDRFDSGEPVRSYRFDYKDLPASPTDASGKFGVINSRKAAEGSLHP